MKTVTVKATTLGKLLDRVRDTAYAHHARYDRKSKSYPFNDDIWRAADKAEFELYAELRASISTADRAQTAGMGDGGKS